MQRDSCKDSKKVVLEGHDVGALTKKMGKEGKTLLIAPRGRRIGKVEGKSDKRSEGNWNEIHTKSQQEYPVPSAPSVSILAKREGRKSSYRVNSIKRKRRDQDPSPAERGTRSGTGKVKA